MERVSMKLDKVVEVTKSACRVSHLEGNFILN